jgi:DNA repair protein RecO
MAGVMEERSPGLLLQATAYLGKQKILKVLTPGVGLISLLAKTVKDSSLTSPFCLAEWVYKKGQKDLHLLIDASLISGLPDLRKSYQTLCAAGQIAQDLLRTSMPGVYSPELFTLASSIFQKMASFDHPEVLILLFRLKWLLQEGLFSFRSTCSLCSAPARHVHEGESYCPSHAFLGGWTFSLEEWSYLEELFSARTFTDLRRLAPNSSLCSKFTLFFQERMQA